LDFRKGNEGISVNLEESGPGVCVSDFNRDSWQDIYCVNWRDRINRGVAAKNVLYGNKFVRGVALRVPKSGP
jgi:hypothetical protein